MGAHGDGIQPAVLLVLAVMSAVVDSAFHAGVRGTFAAAVGHVLHHKKASR